MILHKPHVGRILDGPRAEDLKRLRKQNRQALELTEDVWNFKPCYDPELRARAFPLFAHVFQTMWDYLETLPLHLLFLFREQEQTAAEILNCRGICTSSWTPENNCVFSIGLEASLLNDPDEFSFVLLHEFCHVLHPEPMEHYQTFHMHLDRLLEVYNQRTGKNLKNDYQDLPHFQRYDSVHKGKRKTIWTVQKRT